MRSMRPGTATPAMPATASGPSTPSAARAAQATEALAMLKAPGSGTSRATDFPCPVKVTCWTPLSATEIPPARHVAAGAMREPSSAIFASSACGVPTVSTTTPGASAISAMRRPQESSTHDTTRAACSGESGRNSAALALK